ncbi:MAG TPA: sigma 54-interacting transcriptional regulator [Kofleriaceae bacterium]|nr:sigma 54-interacting transcriptional regulator [Kofleriaceae bacterium]
MTDETSTRSSDLPGFDATELEAPRLIVALECRRPTVAALRLSMANVDEVVIGRGDQRMWARTGRRLELQVPDFEISRQHVRLNRAEGGWELSDLGSKNGTAVNGDPITKASLVDGDLIEMGSVMLLYRDETTRSADTGDLDLSGSSDQPLFRTASVEVERRLRDVAKIAPSLVPALIRGETGTGKELTARAMHALSGRRGPFVPVNCGSLPRSLIESELFGSKRGAFSGSQTDREGLVRHADNGTLFLDEIAELPEESQVALLRVLQEGEVRPVGSTELIRVDVRIVAATHQDLESRIADGRFRQDLYARLIGYVVTLLPLRERREDIGTFIATFLDPTAKVTLQRQAARALFLYPYPLNIRELEQALRTACTLTDDGEIRIEHLPEAIRNYRRPTGDLRPEDQAARARLVELLREHRGNVSAVGRAMGKAPIQIRRWCKRFEIKIASFRG